MHKKQDNKNMKINAEHTQELLFQD